MIDYERDNKIERSAAQMLSKGFNGGAVIVYRDQTHTSLSLAVIANKDFAGRYKITLGKNLDWCVIGTTNAADNRDVREAVKTLATTIEKLEL